MPGSRRILGAWLTSEIDGKAAEVVHEWLGYAALAVLALRIPWGWIGSCYARFSQFVCGPRKTIAYARSVRAMITGRKRAPQPGDVD